MNLIVTPTTEHAVDIFNFHVCQTNGWVQVNHLARVELIELWCTLHFAEGPN